VINPFEKISPRQIRIVISISVVLLGFSLLILPASQPVSADDMSSQPEVVLIELDGAISRVSARFVERGMAVAREHNAELVVLTLDTPGGLLDATRDIVEEFLLSDIPIVVYVAPEGAQAASAGTFIGAAAHILALAPATNIGAASVVTIDGEDLPETLSLKATEDAAAFMRSIAEARGRNISALEATVLSAKAYSASEAVDLNVADLIAEDYSSLLVQLDRYEIDLGDRTVMLNLSSFETLIVGKTFLERLLELVSDPNIAFLLVSLGGTGIIVELWNFGLWIPGTLGVLFLILGWAGIGLLPFSWAGVALMALAFFLLYLESTAPGIGYFGTAGVVSLVLGGLLLVGFFGDPSIPGDAPSVSKWLLASIGVFLGICMVWIVYEARKTKQVNLYKSPTTAIELIGMEGEVTVDLSPAGQILIAGEYWSSRIYGDNDEWCIKGSKVEVVAVAGNHLQVKPTKI
jgi:membrane-bound serine protease (ClpP class)|tara:strand:+ start:1208 stop:2596 length:1389 start_codon:yes stop_codon:yes gene_type:complete